MQRAYGTRCRAYVMRPPQISDERRRHARLFRARRWARTCFPSVAAPSHRAGPPPPPPPLSLSAHLSDSRNCPLAKSHPWNDKALFPRNYTWLLLFFFLSSSARHLRAGVFGCPTRFPDYISDPESIKTLLRRTWNTFLTRKVLNHYVARIKIASDDIKAVMLREGTSAALPRLLSRIMFTC